MKSVTLYSAAIVIYCFACLSEACTPPDPPCNMPTSLTSFSITPLSDSQIRLEWNNVQYETSYKIYRKKSTETSYVLRGTLAADTTVFTDSGLACNTKYYYYVQAWNNCGTVNSTTKYATTYCCSVTKASNPYPADQAVSVSTETLLYWTKGSHAIAHDVYLDTDKNAVLTADDPDCAPTGRGTVPGEECYFDPRGLQPGKTYYWRVDEVNSGEGTCEAVSRGDVWEFSVGKIIYVKQSASGRKDGTSWDNAFGELSDALDVADGTTEIWVAQGRYVPQSGSFNIPAGVAVYGGFAGYEKRRQERNYSDYLTILSGDIEGNDEFGNDSTKSDNAKSVVVANHEVTIDGFTLSDAYGNDENEPCGGISLRDGDRKLTVNNCIIKDNTGLLGGGISSPDRSELIIDNCTITNNSAQAGGGICAANSNITIQRCIIENNISENTGGGLYLCGAIVIANTLIAGNSAANTAGGIYIYNSEGEIVNSTICENKANNNGTQISLAGDGQIQIVNSIIWGNEENAYNLIHINGIIPVITYCNVQGGYNGTGNINSNPLFVGSGDWQDEQWTKGDYHLQPISPCIDAGTQVVNTIDLDGYARPFDYPRVGSSTTYDIGAYETSFDLFRFSIATDIRPHSNSSKLQAWRDLLGEIETSDGKEGEFMVLLGDIDPPATTCSELKTALGEDTIFYPVVGEKDAEAGSLTADMNWFYSYYDTYLQTYVNPGPTNGVKTSYSWDYGFAHFVVLNEYYNGTSDTGTDGDVCDALYNWLAADLGATTKPVIIVLGHEPAYLGAGDSLGQYPDHRNRFWTLLENHNVKTYFCGHTHNYESTYPDGSTVEQILCGSAGEVVDDGEEYGFVDIKVTTKNVHTTYRTTSPGGVLRPHNNQPIANDISIMIEEGGYADIVFSDNNCVFDKNQSYDELTLMVQGMPEGKFTLLKRNATTLCYQYQAKEGFIGEDKFSYQIDDNTHTDNALSQIAAINIIVYAKNQKPLAGDGWGYYGDQPISIDLSSYTADRDGNTADLKYHIMQLPEYGVLDISALPVVVYTPDLQNPERTTFIYRVSDGFTVSRIATIELIPMNEENVPPVANAVNVIQVDEDSDSIEIAVSGTDFDEDELAFFHYDKFTANKSTYDTDPDHDDFGPYKNTSNNSNECRGFYLKEGTKNVFVYRPAPDKNGTDYFRFYASDGKSRSEPVEVVIHIAPINDPPVIKGPSCVSVAKNSDKEFSLEIIDPDNDNNFSYDLERRRPFFGQLHYITPPALYYSSQADNVEDSLFAAIVMDRPEGDIEGFKVSREISIQVLDDGQTVPKALDIETYTYEDVAILQAEPFSDSTKALILKAVNDHGVVLRSYRYVVNTLPDPSEGLLYHDDLLVESGVALSGPELKFVPAENYYGEVTFSYYVYYANTDIRSDDAKVKIHVLSVNDAPRVYDEKRCTQPGTTLSFNLSAADADGDELKWYIQGSQNEESCDLLHGKLEWDKNTLSYMPFAGHSGEDQFKYCVYDGHANSTEGICTIHIGNGCEQLVAKSDRATMEEDGYLSISLDMLQGNRDAAGVSFEILDIFDLHGTLIKGQEAYHYTYIPQKDYCGTARFTFRACGTNTYSAPAVYKIDILSQNDAPSARNIEIFPDENTPTSLFVQGTDIEQNTCYFTRESSSVFGTASQIHSWGRQFKYIPQADYFGPDEFTFRVIDWVSDKESDPEAEGKVIINVIEQGTGLPQVQNRSVETNEDTSLVILLTAEDANRDTLEFDIVDLPEQGRGKYYKLQHGRLYTTRYTEKYVYEPDKDFYGTDSFDYRAVEAFKGGTSPSATITITVHPVNDPPRLLDKLYVAEEKTMLPISLEAYDEEGDEISCQLLSGPVHGQITGTLPDLSYYCEISCIDSINVLLSDGTNTASETVLILVGSRRSPFERKYFSYDSRPCFGTSVATTEIDGQIFLAAASTSAGVNEGRIDIYRLTDSNLELYQTLPLPDPLNVGYGISMKMEGGVIVVTNHEKLFVSPNSVANTAWITVTGPGIPGLQTYYFQAANDFEGSLVLYEYDTNSASWIYTTLLQAGTPPTVSGHITFPDTGFHYSSPEPHEGEYTISKPLKACFGHDFDIEDTTLVVGVPGYSEVYVYSRQSNGTWNHIRSLSQNSISAFPCDEGTTCIDYAPYGIATQDQYYALVLSPLSAAFTIISPFVGYSVAIDNGRIVAGAPGWDVMKWVDGYLYDHLDVGLVLTSESSGTINRGDFFDPCSGNVIAQQFCTCPPPCTWQRRDPYLGTQVRLSGDVLEVDGKKYYQSNGQEWVARSKPYGFPDGVGLCSNGHVVDGKAVLRSDASQYPNNLYGIDVNKMGVYPVHTTNYARAGSFFIVGAPADSEQAGKTGAVYVYNLDRQAGRLVITSGPIVSNGYISENKKAGWVKAQINGNYASRPIYTWAKISGPGTAAFTPNESADADKVEITFSQGGQYTLEVTAACKGQTVSKTVSVFVNQRPEVNPLERNIDEEMAVDIDLTGSDMENSPLTFGYSQPMHGTVISVDADTIRYTPDTNFWGVDSFVYYANDGISLSEPAPITITVNPVPDDQHAVIAENISGISVDEDEFVDIPMIASDEDNDLIYYTVTTAPLYGTVTITNSIATYKPNPHYNGPDSFVFSAADSVTSPDNGIVTITVNPLNDAPYIIGPISDRIVEGVNSSEEIDLAGYFSDVDVLTNSDFLTYTVTRNSNSAAVNTKVSGSTLTLSYTDGRYGKADVTIRATDREGWYIEDSFYVEVTQDSDPPVGVPLLSVSTYEVDLAYFKGETSILTRNIEIGNNGTGGILNWQVEESCHWLEVSPANGASTGESDIVTITVYPDLLDEESGSEVLTIVNTNNAENIETVTVNVEVLNYRRVPEDYPTITEALAAAEAGDKIVVAPGSYYENLDFDGTDIVVTSADPGDPKVVTSTIIRGDGFRSAVMFNGTETPKCKLAGFTISGGHAIDGNGGGIFGNSTEATIEQCVIRDNMADYDGGGIYGCNGIIANCKVIQNSAVNGGGVAQCHGNKGLVNCLIAENTAMEDGGALFDSTAPVVNCTIGCNYSLGENSTAIAENCTGQFINTIVWGNNTGDTLPDEYINCYLGGADPFIACGYWYDNGTPEDPYDDYQVEGDYELSAGSPCTDIGNNNDYGFRYGSLNSSLRIYNGVIDIGAYEYIKTGSIIAFGNAYSEGEIKKEFFENAPKENDFIAISAGRAFAVGLRKDGSLVAWDDGSNANGQCDVPEGHCYKAVAAGRNFGLALTVDGQIVAWGDDGNKQCDIPNPDMDGEDENDIYYTAIAAGHYHGLAIKSDGTLTAWGKNNCGQCVCLPPEPQGQKFIDIAAGSAHSLALQADGLIQTMGESEAADVPDDHDDTGEVIDIAAYNNWSFINVPSYSNGTPSLCIWGKGRSRVYRNYPTDGMIVDIKVGMNAALVLDNENKLTIYSDRDGVWQLSESYEGLDTKLGDIAGIDGSRIDYDYTILGIEAGNYYSLALVDIKTVSIHVNDNDDDKDGIPDSVDGFNVDGIDNTIDDENIAETDFIPIHVVVDNALNPANATLAFAYEAANPGDLEATVPHAYMPYAINEGVLRIWSKDGTTSKDLRPISEGGDFIESYQEYSLTDLGFDGQTWEKTFYIEAVAQKDNSHPDTLIEVRLNEDGAYEGSDDMHYRVIQAVSMDIKGPRPIFETPTGDSPSTGRSVPVVGMNVYAQTYMHNGQLKVSHTNCAIQGRQLPIEISQTYRSYHTGGVSLGSGWFGNWEQCFLKCGEKFIFFGPDGRRDEFPISQEKASYLDIPAGYACQVAIEKTLVNSGQYLHRLRMRYGDGTEAIYETKSYDNMIKDGDILPIAEITTRYVYYRNQGQDASGYRIVFNRDANGRLNSICDDMGRSYLFTYANGRLAVITDFAEGQYVYNYDETNGRLVEIKYCKNQSISSVHYYYTDDNMANLEKIWIGGDKDCYLDIDYIINDSDSAYQGINVKKMTWGGRAAEGESLNQVEETFIYREKSPWTVRHTTTDGILHEYLFERASNREMLCWQTILNPCGESVESRFNYGKTEPRLTQNISPLQTVFKAEAAVNERAEVSDKRDYGLFKSFTSMPGIISAPDGGNVLNSGSQITSFIDYGNVPSSNFGQPLRTIRADGVESWYKYDLQNRNLAEIWMSKQDYSVPENDPIVVKCKYNDYGQIIASLGADGSLTVYDYSAGESGVYDGYLYRVVKTIHGNYSECFESGNFCTINPADAVVLTFMRDAYGRVISEINPKGGITGYTYDDYGRLLAVILPRPEAESDDSSRETISYQYHTGTARDRLDSVIHVNPVASGTPANPNFDNTITSKLSYVYDSLDRPVQIKQGEANSNELTIVSDIFYENGHERVKSIRDINRAYHYLKYNELGRVDWEIYNSADTDAVPSSLVAPAYAVGYDHDLNGQVTDVYIVYGGQQGSPVPYSKTEQTHRIHYDRDWAGRPAQTLDMVTGKLIKQAWDGYGKPNRIEVYDGQGALVSDVSYSYHLNGDIASVTDNIMEVAHVFSADYEQNARQTRDALGHVYENIFDSLGRPYISNYYFGTDDPAAIRLHTERLFDMNGNLEKVASSRQYDNNNSEILDNFSNAPYMQYGTSRYPYQFTVPELGALSRLWISGTDVTGMFQDPLGYVFQNKVDEFGMLSEVKENAANTARITQVQRKRNIREEIIFRDSQATRQVYNPAGQHESTEYYYNATSTDNLGTMHAKEEYHFDPMGRIETVQRKINNQTVQTYAYHYYASDDSNYNNREQLWNITDGTNVLRELADYNRFGQPETLREYSIPGNTVNYVLTTRDFYVDLSEIGAKYGYLKSETTQIVENDIPKTSYTVQYQYDLLGRRSVLIYPDETDETRISYVYEDGFLKQLVKNNTDELFFCHRMDGFELPDYKIYNGSVQVNYGYKSLHLGLVSDLAVGSNHFSTFDYDMRGLKNAAGQWRSSANSYFRDYIHDSLGRLISITSQTGDKFAGEAFPLDQFENRIGNTYIDGKTVSYTSNPTFKNRYNSISYSNESDLQHLCALSGTAVLLPAGCGTFYTYGYDNRGNLTEDEQFVYTWDAFNRIHAVQDKATGNNGYPEVVYYYDALGRRVRADYADQASAKEDVVYVYDGYALIEQRSYSTGVLKQRYYYEAGINTLAMVETLGTTYVPLLDDRGTLMGVADGTGQVIEKLYYNSSGLCKAFTGADVEKVRAGSSLNLGRSEYIPFGWCGMFHDEYTGRYHTHYREYDPVHGRWLSEDPAGYRDGLNLYAAYMGVNGFDPLGLRISSADLLDAYHRLYGSEEPVLKAFLSRDGTIKTGDVWGDLSIWQHVFEEGDPYTITIEEDMDLASASMLLRSGLLKVLGKDYKMGESYFQALGCEEFSDDWIEAAAFFRGRRFQEVASSTATLADLYVSSIGIVNEGFDTVQSLYELSNGNYYAAAGLLPGVTVGASKLLKRGDNVLDSSLIRLVKKADGTPCIDYLGKKAGWWNRCHYAIHVHHIFFRCLGNSDEAANTLSMRMMIHNGQDVGLHWNLLRHMGANNYDELIKKYTQAPNVTIKKKFIDDLRVGYSNFFQGSPDYDEIMKMIDNSFDNVKNGLK